MHASPQRLCLRTLVLRGYLAHNQHPPRTVALCLETYGDLREVGVSYGRGTPVGQAQLLVSEVILYEMCFNLKDFWQ